MLCYEEKESRCLQIFRGAAEMLYIALPRGRIRESFAKSMS